MESPREHFDRHWQPRVWLRLGILVLILAYLIAFVVGNDEEASVNFVFAKAETSLIWVILLSLLAGLLAGVLISQLHARRRALADVREPGSAQTSEASTATPSSISDGDA